MDLITKNLIGAFRQQQGFQDDMDSSELFEHFANYCVTAIEYADEFKDKRQLAVKAFAEALLAIPVTLAENAGIDPLDILNELRSAHAEENVSAGLNLFKNGKIEDMFKAGIIEPHRVVAQAIKSASESAIMIMRIDDVIIARSSAPAMPPGGMPGGMGGMGGMPPGMM